MSPKVEAKDVPAAVKSSHHPGLRTALTCWSTKAGRCLPVTVETAHRGQRCRTPRAAGRAGEGMHGHRIPFPGVTEGVQEAASIPKPGLLSTADSLQPPAPSPQVPAEGLASGQCGRLRGRPWRLLEAHFLSANFTVTPLV